MSGLCESWAHGWPWAPDVALGAIALVVFILAPAAAHADLEYGASATRAFAHAAGSNLHPDRIALPQHPGLEERRARDQRGRDGRRSADQVRAALGWVIAVDGTAAGRSGFRARGGARAASSYSAFPGVRAGRLAHRGRDDRVAFAGGAGTRGRVAHLGCDGAGGGADCDGDRVGRGFWVDLAPLRAAGGRVRGVLRHPEADGCKLPCSVHLEDGTVQAERGRVCATGAATFASALDRVAVLNGIPHQERSWRHSSIASRIRFLTELASDPARGGAFRSSGAADQGCADRAGGGGSAFALLYVTFGDPAMLRPEIASL